MNLYRQANILVTSGFPDNYFQNGKYFSFDDSIADVLYGSDDWATKSFKTGFKGKSGIVTVNRGGSDEHEHTIWDYDQTYSDSDDMVAEDDITTVPDFAPTARLQQDTQVDIGTLAGDFQTGLIDTESTFQKFVTQEEGMLDNTINTVETATRLDDSDVGAGARRIQQTEADVAADVNSVVGDTTGAFDAAIEGIEAQTNRALSSFAPNGAAPAAATRRLQRFR
jgi:hypothetical protein